MNANRADKPLQFLHAKCTGVLRAWNPAEGSNYVLFCDDGCLPGQILKDCLADYERAVRVLPGNVFSLPGGMSSLIATAVARIEVAMALIKS